jgi:hypothetical protein
LTPDPFFFSETNHMNQRQPTKEDMIAALRKIASAASDGRVSLRVFKDETGWDRYWFDKHWPTGGYESACIEAELQRGAIVGIETHIRVTDEELAIKFAEAVQLIGKVPSIKRFKALARMDAGTFCRGETYAAAKRRIIAAYFELPEDKRKGEDLDRIFLEELRRLAGNLGEAASKPTAYVPVGRRSVEVPPDYISVVREFRDRGEEEKRQLVAQFFHQVLGYKRVRVRSEHKHNDVRVNDRRDQPWLVVEVKRLLDSERERRAAKRQGFDYAHRHGMRFVIISDGDYYEVFDRCAGQRLRYDEMRQGSFHLSALRQRDSDLLSLLAAGR